MPKKKSHWYFHPHVRSDGDLSFGEKAADFMRMGMGSWPFVFGFVVFMGIWANINLLSHHPFDPYPFILLNLILSTLAGLQGAILLIAAKRADKIAADLAKYHLEVSEDTKTAQAEHKVILEHQNEILYRITEHIGIENVASPPGGSLYGSAGHAERPESPSAQP